MQSNAKLKQLSFTDLNKSPSYDQNIILCGELSLTASLSEKSAADRSALEQFIKEAFLKVHQAEINCFMPILLSLRDAESRLRAVCGLRHANKESLFLEQYFDAPIEAILSTKVAKKIERDNILEIGNLAIADPSCIRSLLACVAVYLHQTQAEWVVFTGITSLKNALQKLNMKIEVLGEAKLSSLPMQNRAHWGIYYRDQPQVMAIHRLNQG